MKRLLRNSLSIALILSAILGCRKDPPIVVAIPIEDSTCYEDWCYEIPIAPTMLGWEYKPSETQYKSPFFNPNNASEFIYIRDYGGGNTELVKYNITTKAEQILTNSLFIISLPQWSKTGWITFSTTPWRVWKVRDDGTELTQLTFGVNDQDPHFDFSGSSIYYRRAKNYSNFELIQTPDLYKEYKLIGIDLDGNEMDSIMVDNIIPNNYYLRWNIASFYQNKIYIESGTGSYYGVYVLDRDNNNIELIKTWSIQQEGILIQSIDYYEDYVYYAKYHKGIFKTDVNTGEEVKIKIGCGMRSYEGISLSPNGDKMLVTKVILTVLNDYEIDEQREIWLLDVDGCGAEMILGEE